ncbi:MAG: type II toxin-antitoxin system HicB family antitoxin [Dehalococcoidia bacterium]|nr:type II toxin-antitoxin system HicB family antitoxin [Dehalococcoidia bacterium]
MKTFTAYVEYDAETKLYVGIVPGLPGAHTQGVTLGELGENLREVLELCLEETGKPVTELWNLSLSRHVRNS